jgi:hypothetical protein
MSCSTQAVGRRSACGSPSSPPSCLKHKRRVRMLRVQSVAVVWRTGAQHGGWARKHNTEKAPQPAQTWSSLSAPSRHRHPPDRRTYRYCAAAPSHLAPGGAGDAGTPTWLHPSAMTTSRAPTCAWHTYGPIGPIALIASWLANVGQHSRAPRSSWRSGGDSLPHVPMPTRPSAPAAKAATPLPRNRALPNGDQPAGHEGLHAPCRPVRYRQRPPAPSMPAQSSCTDRPASGSARRQGGGAGGGRVRRRAESGPRRMQWLGSPRRRQASLRTAAQPCARPTRAATAAAAFASCYVAPATLCPPGDVRLAGEPCKPAARLRAAAQRPASSAPQDPPPLPALPPPQRRPPRHRHRRRRRRTATASARRRRATPRRAAPSLHPPRRRSPGGSDCLSFSALSESVTHSVYRYLLQRTLNLVWPRVFLIFTDRASFRRAVRRNSLISWICLGCGRGAPGP